jgi:hypothetical protein
MPFLLTLPLLALAFVGPALSRFCRRITLVLTTLATTVTSFELAEVVVSKHGNLRLQSKHAAAVFSAENVDGRQKACAIEAKGHGVCERQVGLCENQVLQQAGIERNCPICNEQGEYCSGNY